MTKKESHDPQNGMKKLLRRLRGAFKVTTGKDDIVDYLSEDPPSCVVFGGPKEAFTDVECETIKEYVNKGGSALFLLHEGGERSNDTNCNTVLRDMGISCNDDSVMRQVYYKYLHPKEVFVEEGVLVADLAKKKVSRQLFFVPFICSCSFIFTRSLTHSLTHSLLHLYNNRIRSH